MSKKKQVKEAETSLKILTIEQVDNTIEKFFSVQGNELELKKKLGEKLLPKYKAGDYSDALTKEITDTALDLMRIRESQHHCNLMEGFNKSYHQLTKAITDQMIIEHGCINEIEKGLASVIVGSYVRYLDNSRRLNNELEASGISPNRNIYIANLSKQVDRAHRQYLSSIQALKMLKMPVVNVKVNVDQAFMAQQQEIHVNPINYDSNTLK